jgi:hypothetical protein
MGNIVASAEGSDLRKEIYNNTDKRTLRRSHGKTKGRNVECDNDSRPGTGVGRLILSRITALPGTQESKQTDDALARIGRRMRRETPTERHEQRQLALYVDPVEPLAVDRWNRPLTEITRGRAQALLQDARNDYTIQSSNRYSNFDLLKDIDPELGEALQQWSDRPDTTTPLTAVAALSPRRGGGRWARALSRARISRDSGKSLACEIRRGF